MFLMVKTWSDINFFIAIAVCFAKNSSLVYIKAINNNFQNLKELINCNITYSSKKSLLLKYS